MSDGIPADALVVRHRVRPAVVTVLGYNLQSEDDVRWAGLDLSRAELRTQSPLMLMVCGSDEAPRDLHLGVPWIHPDDRANGMGGKDFEAIYRIRPRMEVGKRYKGRLVEDVAFERWDGEWWICVRYAPPKRKRKSPSGLSA